jgi:hypothetical protein
MTERSLSRGAPGDRGHGGYGTGGRYRATAMAGPDPGPGPGVNPRTAAGHRSARRSADSKGFIEALFDFSFTSFVTTRIIRVLYSLILVITVLAAFVYTILAFSASPGFGFLMLIIGDPLFIIIVMAFWRLFLESFVVTFRIAEDVHALRERGDR